MYTLNCRGRLLTIDKPVVMGIINATPDSFYKDSRAALIDTALQQAETMLAEGATFLDIGGQSTAPGSPHVEAGEEIDRVLPVIEAIYQTFGEAFLSIDNIVSAADSDIL